jgi:hypothetical protein
MEYLVIIYVIGIIISIIIWTTFTINEAIDSDMHRSLTFVDIIIGITLFAILCLIWPIILLLFYEWKIKEKNNGI